MLKNVHWTVMATPVTASASQIRCFSGLFHGTPARCSRSIAATS
ncbi:MAG: hypothetical protein R3C46_04050 [Hyphomonadaceae bacterium]